MPATPATAAPFPPRPGEPTRSSRLLGIIRKLIVFGRGLAESLLQGPADGVDPRTAFEFGTANINLILQRITRGLMRAAALQERVEEQAEKLDQTPFYLPLLPPETQRAAPAGGPRPAKPPAREPSAADALLAAMPGVEEIAQDVRRRSIAGVLADICRDLGIGFGHPLWTEVHCIMLDHGANASLRLTREAVDRKLAWDDLQALQARQGGASVPVAPEPECAATGPP